MMALVHVDIATMAEGPGGRKELHYSPCLFSLRHHSAELLRSVCRHSLLGPNTPVLGCTEVLLLRIQLGSTHCQVIQQNT